ncbi:hypothetical protein D9M72_437410 [compost metagenome]
MTKREDGDCNRPFERDGEYDDRGHGDKKHDRKVSLVIFASRIDADQRDRKQDQKHTNVERYALDPRPARFLKYDRSEDCCRGQNRRRQKHLHDDFRRKQGGIDCQRQDVEDHHPHHPGTDNLRRLWPRPRVEEPGKFRIKANIACASRKKTIDFADDRRGQSLGGWWR